MSSDTATAKPTPYTASTGRAVSGMRPTGQLHLGHYFGALRNWVSMQETMETFFFVADWHALTTEYGNPEKIHASIPEMVKDWLVSGLNPERAVIFQQSHVKEHAELHLLLSMITPTGWLERCPTYKEQLQQLADKDITTYGFLGYPVLMTSDIIVYRPRWVPVGHDQLPHLEISREICRRFNHLFGDFFPEPEAHLTPAAKCPGLDGRKMSKSYNNGILLCETIEEITPKVKGMLTDKARLRRTDPGNPEVCNLYPYHELLTSPDDCATIREGCVNASFGCVQCKQLLLQSLGQFLAPLHERRAALDKQPDFIMDVLAEGNKKAQAEAAKTLEVVRARMGL